MLSYLLDIAVNKQLNMLIFKKIRTSHNQTGLDIPRASSF